jgi:nucleotide-binding universal stress UspA family protein
MTDRFVVAEMDIDIPIKTIVHPTDCSAFSTDAFAHALRIAIAAKADLHPLHVAKVENAAEMPPFPQAQRMLAQWGLIEENDEPATVTWKLGTRVTNVNIDNPRLEEGILRFLKESCADLVVLATHGRDGLEHWLNGSIAESAFRKSAVPTLFITAGARGFVRQVSGDITLRRVLVPIDHWPAPARAIDCARRLGRLLTGQDVTIDLLHVGSGAPVVRNSGPTGSRLPVIIRYGNVVRSILDAALEYDVDLIVMPTAGHHGILDALRGSTTERVLRHAPCPVYAVPVG